jgi:hypothetical protein
VKRRRAATLFELLVVMAVWSFIMVTVLGFYVYGTKVTRKNDQLSYEIRTIQKIADKFNTLLEDADILAVHSFPPKVIFRRTDAQAPCPNGVLLPNWHSQLEFISIEPDPVRNKGVVAPENCLHNAVFVGYDGQPGRVLMQIPSGLLAEARVLYSTLILSFNNPAPNDTRALIQATPLTPGQKSPWMAPMNHYFQFRGLNKDRTQFIGPGQPF